MISPFLYKIKYINSRLFFKKYHQKERSKLLKQRPKKHVTMYQVLVRYRTLLINVSIHAKEKSIVSRHVLFVNRLGKDSQKLVN